MPLQDTMELERSVLNLVLKSKVLLRQYANKLNAEFFVSGERKFIRESILRTYKSSKGILTKPLFDYDVQTRIDTKDAHFYEAEWNFIVGMTVTTEMDALLDCLLKAKKGRQLLDIAEEIADMVEKGKVDEAGRHMKTSMSRIADHREAPSLVELTDYRHRLDVIMDKKAHPELYLGYKTGFKTFDDRTGGLFPGELTLISGITGLGKSTLLKQIEVGIIKCNVKKNVLHICNEEHLLQVETKFDAQVTEIPYRDFKLATITDEDIEKWKKAMEVDLKDPRFGRIFIKEVPAFTDITLIEETLNELENQGVKIHVVIIDHLPHVKPIEQAWGEYDEQGKAAADCKELARSHHIAVVTATQAATVVEEKQTKGRKAGKMDVYGSKEQVHVSNTSIAITQTGRDEKQLDREEWERDVYWLVDIKKNRDGATFSFKAKHHVRYGLVEEQKEISPKEEEDETNKVMKEVEQKTKGKNKGKGDSVVAGPQPDAAPESSPELEKKPVDPSTIPPPITPDELKALEGVVGENTKPKPTSENNEIDESDAPASEPVPEPEPELEPESIPEPAAIPVPEPDNREASMGALPSSYAARKKAGKFSTPL